MTEVQRRNIAIGVIAIIVIGIVIAVFAGGQEPVPDSVSATRTEVDQGATAVENAPLQEQSIVPPEKDEAQADTKKASGNYNGQCMNKDGSILYGSVVGNKGKDPKSLKTITLKNNNTGKTTDYDVVKANCTFEAAP